MSRNCDFKSDITHLESVQPMTEEKVGTLSTLRSLLVVTLVLQRLDSTGSITHCAYVNI